MYIHKYCTYTMYEYNRHSTPQDNGKYLDIISKKRFNCLRMSEFVKERKAELSPITDETVNPQSKSLSNIELTSRCDQDIGLLSQLRHDICADLTSSLYYFHLQLKLKGSWGVPTSRVICT